MHQHQLLLTTTLRNTPIYFADSNLQGKSKSLRLEIGQCKSLTSSRQCTWNVHCTESNSSETLWHKQSWLVSVLIRYTLVTWRSSAVWLNMSQTWAKSLFWFTHRIPKHFCSFLSSSIPRFRYIELQIALPTSSYLLHRPIQQEMWESVRVCSLSLNPDCPHISRYSSSRASPDTQRETLENLYRDRLAVGHLPLSGPGSLFRRVNRGGSGLLAPGYILRRQKLTDLLAKTYSCIVRKKSGWEEGQQCVVINPGDGLQIKTFSRIL